MVKVKKSDIVGSSPALAFRGDGPRVVVSTAAKPFHARVRGSFPGLGGLKETKMFFPHPLLKLRPPGLEFRILCLKGSVISFISTSSGGSPGPTSRHKT